MSPESRARKPKKRSRPPQKRKASGDFSRADLPAESARYTPRVPVIRFRPTSHKITGWILIVLAIALAVVNDAVRLGLNIMPGGHNELYLFAALGIAAFGGWWLGIFDTPN